MVARILLKRDFLFHADVVAEHHHMQTELQRLARLPRSIFTRCGDENKVCRGHGFDAHLDAARRHAADSAFARVRRFLFEHRLSLIQRRARG